MQEKISIKFKRAIKNSHIQYYLSVNNQTNFVDNSIYESYPCYFDCEPLYKLGIYDSFHMDDNSFIYSLVVEFFSIEKNIHIIAPNLEDIDSNIVPMKTFWRHNLNFDYRTGEPNDEISEFEFAGSYELAFIKRASVCYFSYAFNSAISTFTFVIGSDEKKLVSLLNNKRSKPTVDDILSISDYMVTIKIVEDDEGRNNHIMIQSPKGILEDIEKLEHLMEVFNQKYSQIITNI